MRHGKADMAGSTDSERELTDRGVTQARLVGEYLASQGIHPSKVLVSPSARTRGTWEALQETLAESDADVSILDDLYLGGLGDTLEAIRQVDDQHRVVLVVAHEPTMSRAAAFLANEDASETSSLAQVRIGVPTGSMSVLTSSADSWQDLNEASLVLHTLVRS